MKILNISKKNYRIRNSNWESFLISFDEKLKIKKYKYLDKERAKKHIIQCLESFNKLL